MRSRLVVVLLLATLLTLGLLGACTDSDDDDSPQQDDDTEDDDDDDDIDDDDDDSEPYDFYAGMEPQGVMVDDLLAISSHISKSPNPSWTRDFEIEKLNAAGVGLLRTDFSWSTIEPADDAWNFAGYDTMVDLCVAAGIDIDALLDYGVGWAMPGGSHDEIDPAIWADYTGTVAEHFAERIDVYEVWNEQNIRRFWKPDPNPEHYGELLKSAYTAVHAADPNATVLFGGLAPGPEGMFSEYGLWDFLVRVYDEHPDVCDYFDAMAIHPYSFLQQTSPEDTVDILIAEYPNYTQCIEQARWLLAEAGCPDKPLYLTETGWPHYFIGTQRQGAYLPRSLMLGAQAGIVGYFWYTFWDGSGSAFPPTEDTFGLFTWPGEEPQEKPDYHALLAVHEMIGSAKYAGDLGARIMTWPDFFHAFVFVDDNGNWTIGLWHDRDPLDMELPAVVPLHLQANAQWTLYDQNGDQIDSGTAENNEVQINLKGYVSYLRFSVP